MPRELTAEEKRKYLEDDSSVCPFCGGNVIGGSVEITGGGACQRVSCEDCGARWSDVYTLKDIEVLDPPEEKPTGRAAKCQNCTWRGYPGQTRGVQNLAVRVAPGEPMPVGECPSCGALCHLAEG